MDKLHNEMTDRLFEGILSLGSVDECYRFFEDLCTIKEIQDMSQRFATALLLREGKSYQEIFGDIGVSTGTIGRVNKCMQYGTGGYAEVMDKLKK